jgi:hypothetical protein
MQSNDEIVRTIRVSVKNNWMGTVKPDNIIIFAIALNVFKSLVPVPEDPVREMNWPIEKRVFNT